MTKLALQKELLEKVKPGMKPSDIKKLSKKETKKPVSTPPMSIDEGYESDRSDKSVPIAPSLPNQDLVNQISSLKKQLQTYKDFKEADLKIKEKFKEQIKDLQAKVKEQDGIIAELKNPIKTPTEPKEPQETKTFLCSDCHQPKPQAELSRVFNNFSFCLECSKKARLQAQQEKEPKPQPEEFLCHSCSQIKTELPSKMKLDQTLQTYLICSTCRPTLKEFNEADLITDDL
jgi:hypothetical protein